MRAGKVQTVVVSGRRKEKLPHSLSSTFYSHLFTCSNACQEAKSRCRRIRHIETVRLFNPLLFPAQPCSRRARRPPPSKSFLIIVLGDLCVMVISICDNLYKSVDNSPTVASPHIRGLVRPPRTPRLRVIIIRRRPSHFSRSEFIPTACPRFPIKPKCHRDAGTVQIAVRPLCRVGKNLYRVPPDTPGSALGR